MSKLKAIKCYYQIGGLNLLLFRLEDKIFNTSHAQFYIRKCCENADQIEYPKLLKSMYYLQTGQELDLDNPKTFNEKIQWLKLFDNTALRTKLADKYRVREWVAERIGDDYLIPILGVWEKFDDIDFDTLPSQFVLKANHGAGWNIIVKDKKSFDKTIAREKFEEWLKTNYAFQNGFELQYKDISPKIIAESFVSDSATNDLRDYKFYCFDGIPKMLLIASDRQTENKEVSFDFFDMDGNHLPIRKGHPNANICPKIPTHFEEMKSIASTLSKGMPHVRVDLYEANGKVYFGEITFTASSGVIPFEPNEWNTTIGDMIKINSKKKDIMQ